MMIMPFIRLVSIYVVVIAVVVAIFNRDRIADLTGLSLPWTQSGQSEEAGTAEEAVMPAADTPVETAAVVAPVAEQAREPAIRMPRADPVQQEVTAPANSATPGTAAPGTAPANSAAPGTADTATRLNQARQSYWNGDLAGAEALYAALARDQPDNADVNGEFGNVLYAQRRYGAAADAYFTTGKLLVRGGDPARVMGLVNVLQAIAPDKAATLYAMIAN